MGGATRSEVGDFFARRHEIERSLGEGDGKLTYLSRDSKMERHVALSLVKEEAADADPEGTKREAKVLGRIGSNANIVSPYDYEIHPDSSVQHMVFQYLGSGTLAEHLRAAGPLSFENLLRLGQQLCRGLSHLHKTQLIHRDVSQDNVWLDEHHAAHLGDFGSPIPASDPGQLRPITTNAFAAPEAREGRSRDVRTDLFSLGRRAVCSRDGCASTWGFQPPPYSTTGPAIGVRRSGSQPASESPDDRPAAEWTA